MKHIYSSGYRDPFILGTNNRCLLEKVSKQNKPYSFTEEYVKSGNLRAYIFGFTDWEIHKFHKVAEYGKLTLFFK